jgi:hypothetical protein
MLGEGKEKDMISVRYGESENRPPDVQKNAVGEDRIRDLRIMIPMRYQPRYHCHVRKPTESPQKQHLGFSNRWRTGRVSWAAVWVQVHNSTR